MFGHTHKMATIWVNRFNQECNILKKKCENMHKLEKEHADRMINEDTLDHEGLEQNL